MRLPFIFREFTVTRLHYSYSNFLQLHSPLSSFTFLHSLDTETNTDTNITLWIRVSSSSSSILCYLRTNTANVSCVTQKKNDSFTITCYLVLCVSLCVCLSVYVCVYVCLCVFVRLRVCMCVWVVRVYVHVCKYARTKRYNFWCRKCMKTKC